MCVCFASDQWIMVSQAVANEWKTTVIFRSSDIKKVSKKWKLVSALVHLWHVKKMFVCRISLSIHCTTKLCKELLLLLDDDGGNGDCTNQLSGIVLQPIPKFFQRIFPRKKRKAKTNRSLCQSMNRPQRIAAATNTNQWRCDSQLVENNLWNWWWHRFAEEYGNGRAQK